MLGEVRDFIEWRTNGKTYFSVNVLLDGGWVEWALAADCGHVCGLFRESCCTCKSIRTILGDLVNCNICSIRRILATEAE